MIKTEILAIGKVRKGALHDLCDDYAKRIKPALSVIETDLPAADPVRTQETARAFYLKHFKSDSYKIALDERGEHLSSAAFAERLSALPHQGFSLVQFVIGPADGLPPDIRAQANFLCAFGRMTWPHQMVRLMLTEQIYRAQQIIAGHPYHRE